MIRVLLVQQNLGYTVRYGHVVTKLLHEAKGPLTPLKISWALLSKSASTFGRVFG